MNYDSARVDRARVILDDYLAKLDALSTPGAVALYLQGREVRAFCGHPNKCALAEDIRATFAERGLSEVAIDVGVMIEIMTPEETISRLCPAVAEAFIGHFDAGGYAELVHPDDAEGQLRIARRACR